MKPRKPLKRTGIKRKTPLKRGTKGLKRSYIKRMSKAKRKEIAETAGPRKEYRESNPCALHKALGHYEPATQTHEIACGPARGKAVYHREAWLATCETCHPYLQGMAVERQMAVKLLVDPEYFDLDLICELRGRAKGAITLADVVDHLTLKRN